MLHNFTSVSTVRVQVCAGRRLRYFQSRGGLLTTARRARQWSIFGPARATRLNKRSLLERMVSDSGGQWWTTRATPHLCVTRMTLSILLSARMDQCSGNFEDQSLSSAINVTKQTAPSMKRLSSVHLLTTDKHATVHSAPRHCWPYNEKRAHFTGRLKRDIRLMMSLLVVY